MLASNKKQNVPVKRKLSLFLTDNFHLAILLFVDHDKLLTTIGININNSNSTGLVNSGTGITGEHTDKKHLIIFVYRIVLGFDFNAALNNTGTKVQFSW